MASFSSHEIVSQDIIAQQLVGHSRRQRFPLVVAAELQHRVGLKLGLGERVVVDTRDLTQEQCRQLGALASGLGAAVFSITDSTGHGFGVSLPAGAECRLIACLPSEPQLYQHLRAQHWQGVTVIADVHGNLDLLNQALDWAQSRRHFVCLLGDVIDYGPDTLATADAVHDAVMHGEATMVLANHERKIIRWLDRDGEQVRLSEGNRVTIAALDRLGARERARWIGRFRAVVAQSALIHVIDNVTLLHAAAHPSLWEPSSPTQAAAVEQYALYGESDQSEGRYKRIHRWIDSIPSGKLVIVGHTIMATFPLILTGAKGGKAIFLDTGCGKGGPLSSADLRFTDDSLRLECFNQH